VKLADTLLSSEDGETITIPNKIIVDEIIYNSKANLIIEASVRIAYNSEVNKAIVIIQDVLESNSRVVAEPQAQVGIQRFAESAMELGYRYWVPTRVYYEVMYEVNKMIDDGLKQADIVIPFPQRDVHIINEGN
jgi:small conductance mechanosensitive channel